jgi:hypothetical protein
LRKSLLNLFHAFWPFSDCLFITEHHVNVNVVVYSVIQYSTSTWAHSKCTFNWIQYFTARPLWKYLNLSSAPATGVHWMNARNLSDSLLERFLLLFEVGLIGGGHHSTSLHDAEMLSAAAAANAAYLLHQHSQQQRQSPSMLQSAVPSSGITAGPTSVPYAAHHHPMAAAAAAAMMMLPPAGSPLSAGLGPSGSGLVGSGFGGGPGTAGVPDGRFLQTMVDG